MGFPGGSASEEFSMQHGRLGLDPGLGRSPGAGNSYPLQYSGLEDSTDLESDTTERLSLDLAPS